MKRKLDFPVGNSLSYGFPTDIASEQKTIFAEHKQTPKSYRSLIYDSGKPKDISFNRYLFRRISSLQLFLQIESKRRVAIALFCLLFTLKQ